MRQIYLIRHGQASFGSADYDRLSELGNEQARFTGEWFRRCGIDIHHAVAGGLKRHIQTAEAFFGGYDDATAPRTILRDSNFNEIDQVDILNPTHARGTQPLQNGTDGKMSFDQYRERYKPAFFRWIGGRFDHEYGQTFADFNARCSEALRRTVDLSAPGETVAAFTSGGTIGTICRAVLGLNDQATMELMTLIGNTSVTQLQWDQGRFALKLFNSTAHLDHRGDPRLLTIL